MWGSVCSDIGKGFQRLYAGEQRWRELARDRVRRGRLFLIQKVPVHVHLFMGRTPEDEKFITCDGGNCRKKAHKGEKE